MYNNLNNANNLQEFHDQVENYLNQDHISSILINNNVFDNHGNFDGSRYDSARAMNAAIINNPNNLVLGPVGQNRANDPAQKNIAEAQYRKRKNPERRDLELLKFQTPEHQGAHLATTANFDLNKFGAIPETVPLNYQERNANDKRFVATGQATRTSNVQVITF